MKKNILKFIYLYFVFITNTFATAPWVVCNWLPWCESDGLWTIHSEDIWNDWFFEFLWNIISTWINYVPVMAVIALIVSWIMYMLSIWDDEKTKKAKNAIIWSLVWVLISTSAWFLINMLNNFNIS